MKHTVAMATPLFAALMLISTIAIANTDLQIPTVENDVTIVDEYYGRINSSHPMYWGNYTYFLSANLSDIFFIQKGGCHNHATYHTQWNEPIWIEKLTNIEYIEFNETEGQVIAHYNDTHVFYSNNQDQWIPNRLCPLCNGSMHGYEYSPYSTAIYWQCKNCRLIIGEILAPIK
jgi:hypothetical protein